MKQKSFLGMCAILCVATLFCSCDKLVKKTGAYKELKNSLDSISVESQQKDADLMEICKIIDDVVAGLENIKAEEKALALQASSEMEMDASAKARVGENVKTIALSIEKYKQQISKLESKMKTQSAAFRATISRLKSELEEKDQQMAELTEQLGLKDIQFSVIQNQVRSLQADNAALSQRIDSINGKVASQQEVIENQENTIHAGFYVMGKQSELTKANVLLKKKVNPKVNTKKFTKVDIRTIKDIALKTKKKVKVISSHPASSYSIVADKAGMKTLKIKNADEFWRQTKYLVVVTK